MSTVELYISPYCGYCHAAKRLLTSKSVSFQEIDLSLDPGRRSEMLARANGLHTVPQIFINDQHIGGCDDLHALERSGKLGAMLAV